MLLAGPLAVVFVGQMFFFEWTVVLRWENVVHVQKKKDGVAIKHQTTGKPETTYVFEQFGLHLDRAWSTLVSFHNDSMLDPDKALLSSPRNALKAGKNLRRTNSDPLRMSSIFNFDDSIAALHHRHEEIEPSLSAESIPMTISQYNKTPARTVSEPIVDKNSPLGIGEKNDSSSLAVNSRSSKDLIVLQGATSSGTPSTTEQNQTSWSGVVNDTKESYSECTVEKLHLPCSIQMFVEKFIKDNAEYSIPKFMMEYGDEDFECSLWESSEDGASKCRKLEYTHPVNAPMAPPKARARKEQTYRIYGSDGFVLETRTYVSDVPMTDCFYVADRVLVGAVDKETISVSIFFDIRFVKSNMFKSIISRTTKNEFETMMQRLSAYLTRALGKETQKISTPPVLPTSPIQHNMSSAVLHILTLVLLVVVIALQMHMIADMRAMKREVRLMHESMSRQCLPQFERNMDSSTTLYDTA